MGVYDRQIATAQRLIAKKGQLCNWVPQDVTITSGQPWRTNQVSSPPTFPVSILFVPAGKNTIEALFHLMQGSDVPVGGPKGLMGAVTGFTPAITDTVQRGTENLTVKSIDEVNLNGEIVLYKIDFE